MAKRCSRCGNESVIGKSYLRALCKSCFLKALEKKIRKDIRINEKISKDDRLLVDDKLSSCFVKKIISMPIKLVKTKPDKIVKLYSLDDKVNDFLAEFMLNKKPRRKKNDVSFFETITDEELEIYCRVKKIDFRPNKKDKSIQGFLDRIYKRYPEARFSIAKSSDEIRTYQK